MFREIRTREKIERVTDKKTGHNEYQSIKPETDITVEEANAYWEKVFENLRSKEA